MNKLLDKNTYSLSEVSSSEIGDMQGTINSLLEENKEKFLRISNVDPSFSHTLYKPSNPVGIKKIFLKPLMLKQIDNLMDESDILIKKQEQLAVKGMENNEITQTQIQKQANHFMVLRSAWTKFSSKNVQIDEHVDNLNKVVGMIKNNINNLIKKQNTLSETEIYSASNTSGLESARFKRQREKKGQSLEKVLMQNQELRGQIFELKEELKIKNNRILQLQNKIGQYNETIRKKNTLLTERQCSMLKIQGQKSTFQSKLNDLTHEINKFKERQGSQTMNQVPDLMFKSRSQSKNNKQHQPEVQNQQIVIPDLSLTVFSPTNRKNCFSDRLNAKNKSTFIPMRTQRKNSNQSQLLKTTVGNSEVQEDLPQKVKKFMRTTRMASTDKKKDESLLVYKKLDSL